VSGRRTRWRGAALAGALVLAGCASAPPPGEGGVPGLVTTARVIGPEAAYVEAVAAHGGYGYRLVQMTLVDPAGRQYPAIEVRNDVLHSGPGGYRPSGAVGVGAGSGGYTSVGFGIAFPLVVGGRRDTVHRMRATFRVPDPAGYRRDPTAWRIRLLFTGRDGLSTVYDRAAPFPGR